MTRPAAAAERTVSHLAPSLVSLLNLEAMGKPSHARQLPPWMQARNALRNLAREAAQIDGADRVPNKLTAYAVALELGHRDDHWAPYVAALADVDLLCSAAATADLNMRLAEIIREASMTLRSHGREKSSAMDR